MKTFRWIIVLAVAALPAFADTLKLKDGTIVDGTFLGGDSRNVKFLGSTGAVKSYPLDEVAAVGFGDASVADAPAAPAAPADAGQTAAATAPKKPPVQNEISAPRPGSPAPAPAPAAPPKPQFAEIPAGTVVTVRTIDSIDSGVNGAGEQFRASLDGPIMVDGEELAAQGADALVRVTAVDKAGAVAGKTEVALELSSLTLRGREYTVASNFAEVSSKNKGKKTAKRAGIGAAIGAGIGAIAGGGKGAAIGAAAGGGAGTIYSATKGTKVQIPSETLLNFTLRAPVRVEL